MNRSRAGNAAAFLSLAVFGVFIALPMYYSVINAFKPISELFLFPPRFVVYHPTLQNFAEILRVQSQSLIPVERYVFNSVFVTAASTGGYILLASMAGYAMAKLRFPGKTIINRVIVFAILFRPEVTALPQYMLMAKTGMLDTFWALILPLMSTSFGVFLMGQFISAIPDDVLEAARIDGAGEKYSFFKIVLPMMRPAWMTLMILTFISSWNVTGAQFTYSESMKMLPTMMQQINTGGIIRTGVTAAVSVLLMLPPIVIFLFCENSVVETMAYSGIKS
ncbi:carbohydrate ABC transporter permease [Anaeromassilibacillus sp. SJQ-5]